LLRRFAIRLRSQCCPTLADCLIDDGQIGLQGICRSRIELALFRLRDLFQPADRLLIVFFRLTQLGFDRLCSRCFGFFDWNRFARSEKAHPDAEPGGENQDSGGSGHPD
jgi:hypothetical protein